MQFFVSECSEDTCLVKTVYSMYLGDNREKNWSQSVITLISPIRLNDLLKTASSLLKGWGRCEPHVTLIQEMNGQ